MEEFGELEETRPEPVLFADFPSFFELTSSFFELISSFEEISPAISAAHCIMQDSVADSDVSLFWFEALAPVAAPVFCTFAETSPPPPPLTPPLPPLTGTGAPISSSNNLLN